ncbi:MAG: 1-acyl-sn-glycerol-3-phosphate acyltransferase, partial [Muribaculaceae bacterium]|nr:1-acyl-sn-glycerol-3-phosphate acyltransferase [Muribaculaceae bacterium]
MSDFKPIQINLDEVLRTRAPRHYKYIPRWAVRKLERTIHQDELNQILVNMGTKTGVDAADSALHDLQVQTTLIGTQNIPPEGRFIFVSNHPLGGLDGMALMSAIGHRYNGNIRFIVNDLLMAVKPLQPILLPVNKHGRQARQAAAMIEQEYQGDNQMITFPAGLCSRMGKKGVIHDLEWKKFIIT